MDILYAGLLFCEESLQEEFQNKRKVSMAPHKFQSSLIRGLEMQENIDLKVINIPPTGSFPINHRKLFCKAYRWGKQYLQLGYVNLPWIKHEMQKVQLYQKIKRYVKQHRDAVIILYSLYEPFLCVGRRIKKEYPDVSVCILHTDAVPGRNDMERYMNKAAVRRGNRAVRLAKCADSFILLTENLVEPIEAGSRPYLVVECICDEMQRLADTQEYIPGTFLYTGEISHEFGVYELAKAFCGKNHLQLWLCGDGDAREEIEKISQSHPNIRCFGYVKPEKITQLQDQCAFLINPRRPSGTYTKYSFPSKTAEYMMTGKPVIMYKLEAIPDAYDAYLNYLTADGCEGLAREIEDIIQTDYQALMEKARCGREYMLNNRNAGKVGREVAAFLATPKGRAI